MPSRRVAILLAAVALVATTCFVATAATAVQGSSTRVTAIWLKSATYTPKAPAGATDDYHCTLLNPHVSQSSYIISSQFFPGSPEDHHAILFLVPPNLAATAEADNVGGNGWSCFGETPIPNTGLAQISNTPWLSAWAPGHGADSLPKGTGIFLPAGSLVVMQVHYNLLVGDKSVRNSLQLHTVPASTPLLPLKLDLMPAPPDIPCPTGVTGPLCDRQASLTNLGQRFGQSAVIRQYSRVDLRSQPQQSTGRGHDVVQLARLPERLHRAGRRPHAPPRTELQDGPQPGDAAGEDGSQRPGLQLPLPAGLQPEDADRRLRR